MRMTWNRVVWVYWLLIAVPSISLGQNLVPNPSFEQFNNCPGAVGGIVYPNPPANPYPTVADWANPVNASTPDYFNTCATLLSSVGVPVNIFGYAMPHTGNAYVGMYVIEERVDGNYREYIMARLSQALQAGRKYYVSFFVKRAGMNTRGNNAPWFSNANISTTDDIGAYVSQRKVDEPQYKPLSFTPQARNPTGNYIDTIWTLVDGVMTADGGERWITIGNFNPVNNYVTLEVRDPSDETVPVCYFYVDDVCVVDVTDNIRTHEIRKCGNDLVQLQATQLTGKYHWSTGDTTRSITVSDTGVYWVSMTAPCAYWVDSFRVYQMPISGLDLGRDTSYCSGVEAEIKVNTPFTSYRWNTGDTTSFIRVREAGTYVVTVTDGCEFASDTIIITYFSEVSPPAVLDTQFCLNQEINGWHFDTTDISWYADRDGARLKEIPAPVTTEAGTYSYWIARRMGECESKPEPFTIRVIAPPDDVVLPDTLLCDGVQLELSVGRHDAPFSFRWSNGDSTCCTIINVPGLYHVTISNECGTVYGEAELKVLPCENCIWMPNAFSPTGNGINDVFRAVVRCPVTDFELRIFNRWGQLVFQTVDPTEAWDGNYRGVPAPLGVYFYIVRAMSGWSDKSIEIFQKGEVHLIR